MKRNRQKPIKRWADEETLLLARYLQENRDNFEKPSANIFYNKFIAESGMDTDSYLIKHKVRNMRVSYEKALNCQNSIDCGVQNREAIIANTVQRICPYFNILHTVFWNKKLQTRSINPSKRIAKEDPSIESTIPNEFDCLPEPSDNSMFFLDELSLAETNSSAQTSQIQNHDPVGIVTTANYAKDPKTEKTTNRKKSNSALTGLMSVQNERLQLLKSNNILELEKFEFDKKKFERELQFKEEQLRVEERIKMEEIKSKEKIAIMELKLKYGLNNKSWDG